MKLSSQIAVISFLCAALLSSAWLWDVLRPLPDGYSVAGVSVGGLGREEVREKLEDSYKRMSNAHFHFMDGDTVLQSLSAKELGLHYNLDRTVQRLFDGSNWMVSLLSPAEKETQHQGLDLWIDNQQLQTSIESILLSEESGPRDAEIIWKETRGGWVIRPERDGKMLQAQEPSRLAAEVLRRSAGDGPVHKIQVTFEEDKALVRKEELSPILKDLQKRVNKDIVIEYLSDEYELSLRDSPKWISWSDDGTKAELSRPYLIQRVQEFANLVDLMPEQVKVVGLEEKISEYDNKPVKNAVVEGEFSHGYSLKQGQMRKDLRSLFSDPEQERRILSHWDTRYPEVLSQVEGYSFPQLISTGVSSYRYGNQPNRVKNIKLSLEAFQGVVIEPGEEFSFNRATGWITPAKGYTKTKIIEEGRVADGVGGGVCQSSTTLFRAVLNAGLPLVERRNHSLDIHYYHEFGYGLDATVYTDARSDFRFVNDFQHPLLANIYFDDEKDYAHVEFYGTSDGRQVHLTNIPTGNYLRKQWEWKVQWPDREELRYVNSVYIVPKEEKVEEEEVNPLEA